MNIRILSRTKAVKLSYTDFTNDKVIISIKDPWAEKAHFNSGNSSIKEVLYLSFYDISEETKDIFGGYSSMSPDDALKIAHFINKWKDKVDTIWVHCEVGVSRSAGIAMAIMEYLNMDLTPIFENPTYSPNMLCYELTKQGLRFEDYFNKGLKSLKAVAEFYGREFSAEPYLKNKTERFERLLKRKKHPEETERLLNIIADSYDIERKYITSKLDSVPKEIHEKVFEAKLVVIYLLKLKLTDIEISDLTGFNSALVDPLNTFFFEFKRNEKDTKKRIDEIKKHFNEQEEKQ